MFFLHICNYFFLFLNYSNCKWKKMTFLYYLLEQFSLVWLQMIHFGFLMYFIYKEYFWTLWNVYKFICGIIFRKRVTWEEWERLNYYRGTSDVSFSVILVHPSFLCQILSVHRKGWIIAIHRMTRAMLIVQKKVAIFFIYILIKQDYSALIAISLFWASQSRMSTRTLIHIDGF